MAIRSDRKFRSGALVGSRVLAAACSVFWLAPRATAQGYVLGSLGGPVAGGRFGLSVAAAGDVDGDGVPDVVVGAPYATVPTTGQYGEARVLSGATGAVLLVLGGPSGDLYFGWAVAGTGDVDGDAVPDVLVGARGAFPGGRATLYSVASGAPLFTFTGAAGSALGSSVAGPGDVDGDGVPDAIVGAPGTTPPGLPLAGAATIFSGATGLPLFTFTGGAAGDRLGASVAGAGDVNADGFADVVVGAPFGDAGPLLNSGTATVFSGASGLPLFTFAGTADGDQFGFSVAGAGDADGDGVPDTIVGAPTAFTPPLYEGAATLFSGASGLPLFTVFAAPSPAQVGSAVGDAGDANADGFDDFLVGAYFENVATGLHAGTARLYSGASGLPLLTVAGSTAGEYFGYSLVGAGDLNGDGFPDVVAGAPEASPGGLFLAGSVAAFSFVGLPAASSPYGAGCPGSGGISPLLTTSGGQPVASANSSGGGNASFRVYVSNALGGATAFLAVGTIPLVSGLDLGPFGSPGCFLHVQPFTVLPVTTSGSGPGEGRATVPLPVPGSPALVGAAAYLQWYVVDPGPFPAPGALTQGLLLLIL